MAVFLSPIGNDALLDSNGNPANGYLLYTYAAGSSTPLATFTTSAGTTPQANPIVLNARGEPDNLIWLTGARTYKYQYKTAAGVNVGIPIDNISGINDASSTSSQWIASGVTPTYVSATTFTLAGDQTTAFHVRRRIKSTTSAGTIYSRITASVYTTSTLVTVVNDSGVFDSGLSIVELSLLTSDNPSYAGSTSTPFYVSSATERTQAITAGQIQDSSVTWCGTNTGTADAIVLTPSPAITAYVAGQTFMWMASGANTTAVTIAVSGLAAKSAKKNGTTALAANDIPSGAVMEGTYDGTNFQVRIVADRASLAANTFTGLQNWKASADIASAATVDLTAATGNITRITGAVATSAITMNAGQWHMCIADGAWPLTQNATTNKLNAGGASYTCAAGDRVLLHKDNSGIIQATIIPVSGAAVAGGSGDHRVVAHSGNGYGSTATKIRRFTTLMTNVGTAITYADSAANGSSFTINAAGIYAAVYTDTYTVGTGNIGISLNAADLTLDSDATPAAQILDISIIPTANAWVKSVAVFRAIATDVVRAHSNGVMNSTANLNRFSIIKIG